MNDFSEIEAELKKLRPAQIRAELTARIERALAEQTPAPITPTSGVLTRRRSARTNWISLGLGIGLAAAAGFLMLARVSDDQKSPSQKTVTRMTPTPARNATGNDSRLIPAGFTEIVYNTRDEGLQFPDGAEQPMRQMRYQTSETLRWRNPETGASLRISYPSEEVVLIPVSGQ